MNISETTLRRILHKELSVTPIKVQWVQELKPVAQTIRFRFAKWACDRLTEDSDFDKKKSSFQMKLIFILPGIGTQKTRMHTLKSQCTQIESPLSADFGPEHNWALYLFQNEQEVAVTVNGDRYRAMWNESLFIKIEDEDIRNIWFQQNGATCHTAEATFVALRSICGDRIISRRADIVWPSLSCDLTPLDYYLSKISVTPASQRQLTLKRTRQYSLSHWRNTAAHNQQCA